MSVQYFESTSIRNKYMGVTIGKRGQLYIPEKLAQTIDERFCMLGYDADKKQIVVKLLKTPENGSVLVTKCRIGTIQIWAFNFLEHFKIKHNLSRRYPAEREGDLLIIKLK